jgi:hypothetical protein
MFSGNFFAIALQVIRSWQVIVVTVAIVLYISLVSYVAKTYNKRRPHPPKPNKENAAAKGEDISDTDDDELGLEEE